MSDKKRNKNPFLYFRSDEVVRLKSLDPPLTKLQDVNPIISEGWAKIKKDNGDKYKHYLKLASGVIEQSTEQSLPINSISEPEYQVTKPFHKFSLEKRKEFEMQYVEDSAIQITQRLVESWNSLTKSQKNNWVL